MALPYFPSRLNDPELRDKIAAYLGRPSPPRSDDPEALAPAAPLTTPDAGDPTPAAPLDYDPREALARRFLAARRQGELYASANHLGALLDAANLSALRAKGVEGERAVVDRPEIADKPVNDLVAQLRYEATEHKDAAKSGKAGLSNDPNSPEAKALQDAWKARHPETPGAVVSTLTPVNFEQWRKDYATGAEIDARKAASAAADERLKTQIEATKSEGQLNRSVRWADLRQQAELAGANADLKLWIAQQELQAKKDEATAKTQAKLDAVAVPGFDLEEGAKPSVDDAKKVKEMAAARERMLPAIAELRALHKRAGLTLAGPDAEQERRLLTQLQIESKNVAGLGALSGPDYALMHAISTTDPTTVGSVLKQFFGVTDINRALDAMERWATNNLQGTAKALGYKPSTKRVPAPTDSTGRLNLDGTPSAASSGAPQPTVKKHVPPPPGMKQVRWPDGRVVNIPADKLREAITRFNATEVK